jgi:hypothetical protein
MNEKDKLKEQIKTLVNEELAEVSPVFYPAIKKGMEAGRKTSQQRSSSYRGHQGQSFADEIAQIRRDAARKHDLYNKMSSLTKYMEKKFPGKASGGTAFATVKLGPSKEAIISGKLVDGAIFDGVKFVVKVRENGKDVLEKEFPAGLGAKEAIAKILIKLI